MTDILMPRLTDQMEEGTVVAWLVEEGQAVSAGQDLVEIETDKATMAHASEGDGVLQVVAGVGDTIQVGEVIARLSDVAAEVHQSADPKVADDPPLAASPSARAEPGRIVTPLARRAASMHDVDLNLVKSSGPAGRVTKADVLRAAGVEDRAEQPIAPPGPPPPDPVAVAVAAATETQRSSRVLQPSRLQQIVARRMTEAKATVPHFQVQTEVQMDAAFALRAELQATAGGEPVPSISDLIVRACARTLREHPSVNGSFVDGVYELHDSVDVGLAVAQDDGLVVVTIPDADIKSLEQIGRESRRLAERARAGTVTPQELAGATFTVSNLGMFGMTAITPVINPPQAAILGVGAARTTLARDPDGAIVDRRLLTLTLSCDHRILNGADSSRFLLDLKHRLEAPLRLAL